MAQSKVAEQINIPHAWDGTRPELTRVLGTHARAINSRTYLDNFDSAGTLGSLVRRVEVFDASGASMGFIPIYSSISGNHEVSTDAASLTISGEAPSLT